jgi:hypothetical protein
MNRILAVVTVQDGQSLPQAQLVLRQDGALQLYGDPSQAIDALSLLLRAGPAWIAAQRDTPAEG